MGKLHNIIEHLPYQDLVALKKDVQAGNVERLINKRIESMQPTKAGICPVCSTHIDSNENLTLTFGPANFRQRASFDGPDCLIYFLDQLKK